MMLLGGLGVSVLTGMLPVSGLPGGRSTLHLRATDDSGLVRIEWNPSSAPILEVSTASILIVDGGERIEKSLSPEVLHHGSLLYQRKSPDVRILLQVDGAEPAQALTHLTGLPAARVAADHPEPASH